MKLSACVAFACSMFMIFGITITHAADPAFCKQYARAALNQVRAGLSSPRCAGGLRGSRWSTDFSIHYEWCLGASVDAAGTERDSRANYLRACR